MKKILVSLVTMLFLYVPMVFGLSITDEYYLGSILPGTPAGDVAEVGYVTQLIGMTVPSSVTIESRTYTRSSNEFLAYPTPVYVERIEFEDEGATFSDVFFTYMLAKFGTDSYVWYIADLTSFVLPEQLFGPGTGSGLSHVTFFNPTQQVPEPTTLLLFGAGIAGLALCRRRRS